jgi:preprotein translocase subunit SecG
MSTIFTLFMILIIIASILLVIIIMAQNPKGGGLSGTFGSFFCYIRGTENQ